MACYYPGVVVCIPLHHGSAKHGKEGVFLRPDLRSEGYDFDFLGYYGKIHIWRKKKCQFLKKRGFFFWRMRPRHPRGVILGGQKVRFGGPWQAIPGEGSFGGPFGGM